MGEAECLKMKFWGAAREVTGSKTELTYQGRRYLVDCGLFQGERRLREQNWADLPHAAGIEAVVLTHAHIDHCGYLPRLVKQGFRGRVYCTDATAALVGVMLRDAAHLQEEDAAYANESGHSSHRPALPLFTLEDAERAIRLLTPLQRGAWTELCPGLSFRLIRSGHLLGSSFAQFSFRAGENNRLLTFSGDLGSERSLVIKGPDTVEESDYLVLEGTYGDKAHRPEGVENKLAELIKRVHSRKGTLLIPAFAVGRTQELLHMINTLESAGKIPSVPIYIDSPMALKATELYTRYEDDLRPVIDGRQLISSMDESRFIPVLTPQQSKALMAKRGPMIIISAAGMLTGGRVLHHLRARLPHRSNAVAFVGFQARGTKGRLLLHGIDRINIHHEAVPVEAEIVSLDGLSAHADSRELVAWTSRFRRPPGKIFLNHGEPEALQSLAYRLRGELGLLDVVIPHPGEEYELV